MNHSLLKLTQRLCNRPHLISVVDLHSVVNYLDARNNGVAEMRLNGVAAEHREPHYNQEFQKGLLPIEGTLTNIHYQGLCGESGVSYESLVADVEKLISLGAKEIVLDVDSGGGEAYGCFEAASLIKEMCQKNNVRITSYVDGSASSAAYALACIADEIVVNPMADVGSIGVVVQLYNANKSLAKNGIERTFVFAGDNKIPFDANGDFTPSFISDLQSAVDSTYAMFTGHVAKYRKMSVQDVVATQAKSFLAADAVKTGLADKIMTKKEFLDYVFTNKLV